MLYNNYNIGVNYSGYKTVVWVNGGSLILIRNDYYS